VLQGGQQQTALEQELPERKVLVELFPMKLAEGRRVYVGVLIERVTRLFDLLTQPDVAVLHATAPFEVEDVVDLLQEHGNAFQTVSQLRGHRRQVQAAHLLEICELRDLLAVQHHLPADPPGAQRGRLPVVFLEANVVLTRIDATRLEAVQIDLLDFVRRRLEDDLHLQVLEQSVRILPEPAVVGTPGGLHVGDVPRPGTKDTEQGLRVRRSGPDFKVERLLDQTTPRSPERGEFENEVLEGHCSGSRLSSFITRIDFNSFSRCDVMSAWCFTSSSRKTRVVAPRRTASAGAT